MTDLDNLGKARKALLGQTEAGLLSRQKHAAIAAPTAGRIIIIARIFAILRELPGVMFDRQPRKLYYHRG
jgi:hypothetical protein